jgi:hypothetical protein
MPKGKEAEEFFERLARLEVRVEALMTWQKWQMGILSGLVLIALKAWIKG